jgi:sterol 3beta-glucosyltransferase
MIIKDPERLETCMKEAAKITNRRVLVQSGWTKLNVEDETGLCHNVGPCPHDWLLPQCCAVIHHGTLRLLKACLNSNACYPFNAY